ncbi:hypothetical protein CBR_g32588 [Chara braunii]|uniref:Uncharacterized protein n=1 Tax=Chara braunii TaxID=69332 RepID=A0A388LH08_CHABU|nr:hypothetical protein CBR_g32588 [Chara braunii]|eukprot:GBG81596.1 hypothetical protein CBR_g32588 [Chara braunii]
MKVTMATELSAVRKALAGKQEKDNVAIEKLRTEVEEIRRGTASTSTARAHAMNELDFETVEKMQQNQEKMKKEQEDMHTRLLLMVSAAAGRAEAAEREAVAWRLEANRPGNKRGSIMIIETPVATTRVRARMTPQKSPAAAPNGDYQEIMKRHAEEVECMKVMRLKELNGRRQAEQEVERLKEEIARLETARKRERMSGINLRQKLDEVGAATARKTTTGKEKMVMTNEEPIPKDNDKEGFTKECWKMLQVMNMEDTKKECAKEGVTYTTLEATKKEILPKKVARAFPEDKGKGIAVHEIEDDTRVSDDTTDEQVSDSS